MKNTRQGAISVKIGIIACLLGIIMAAPLALELSMNQANTDNETTTTASVTTTTTATTIATSSTSNPVHHAVPQNCLGNKSLSLPLSKLRIALIKPVFTSTPYSQYRYGSFYAFYHKYGALGSGNVTSDLQLLNTPVSSALNYNQGWGLSYGFNSFINSQGAKNCGLELGQNVFVLSDINLTQGGLFFPNDQRNKFDVVVMGFTEYATEAEYDSLWRFVATGGTLILMGGQNFLVKVSYNSITKIESLVLGHGWAFNGKSAWQTNVNPWAVNNTDWVGSNFCCFHSFKYDGASLNPNSAIGAALISSYGNVVFKSYVSHEESSLTNRTQTTIVARFINQSSTLVASYIHEYKKGRVVCFCVFGDDIISSDSGAQYFLVQSILSAVKNGTEQPNSSANMSGNQLLTLTLASTIIISTLSLTLFSFLNPKYSGIRNRVNRRFRNPSSNGK